MARVAGRTAHLPRATAAEPEKSGEPVRPFLAKQPNQLLPFSHRFTAEQLFVRKVESFVNDLQAKDQSRLPARDLDRLLW